MFVSLLEKDSHQIGTANVPTDTPPVVGLSIIQGGMAAEVAEENELDQANNYYKHQAFRFIHQNCVFFETAKFGIFSYTDKLFKGYRPCRRPLIFGESLQGQWIHLYSSGNQEW